MLKDTNISDFLSTDAPDDNSDSDKPEVPLNHHKPDSLMLRFIIRPWKNFARELYHKTQRSPISEIWRVISHFYEHEVNNERNRFWRIPNITNLYAYFLWTTQFVDSVNNLSAQVMARDLKVKLNLQFGGASFGCLCLRLPWYWSPSLQ